MLMLDNPAEWERIRGKRSAVGVTPEEIAYVLSLDSEAHEIVADKYSLYWLSGKNPNEVNIQRPDSDRRKEVCHDYN